MILNGAIVLLLGLFFLAQGHGKLRFHKDPDRNAELTTKLGPTFRVLAPILIVAGALMIVAGFVS